MNPPKQETQQTVQPEAPELEDTTCCHRITFFSPRIRNIQVTEPVSSYLCQGFTWSTLFWLATVATILAIGWATLYFLIGDTMLPWNLGFGLYSITIVSYTLGWSLSLLPYLHLPPVFGMLLGGLLIRNTGLYDIHEDLDATTTSKIRTFCMTFIMIRVGLQLSLTSLKRYTLFLIILALVPSTIELIVIAICCRTILGYPWDWSFMVGAILTCMSPVVTMNCVLSLAEQGYGKDKNLASVLCTAACIEDVHVVSMFVVCFSIVFGNGETRTEWWFYIPAGLRDFLLGIVAGVALGVCFIFFPHRDHKYATWHRMINLVLGSLMCTVATANVTMSGGGYLAVVVLSFIAITGWRILSATFQSEPFTRGAYILWHLAQPILVGVMGADINLTEWPMPRFGLHILCIIIGLTARSIAVYLSAFRTPFTWKEKLFVVVSWIPKGTLQAALGPMAFERLKNIPEHEHLEMALDVMRISVITMLLMAPIGAVAITSSGPLLLNQITVEENELQYLRKLSLQPGSEPKKLKFPFFNQQPV